MGGRGASSASSTLFPSIAAGMDIEQAMHSANPNFNKGVEYRINCQRCVYAYEMNRRGEDCIAKPAILNSNDSFMERQAWSHTMNGQKWFPVGSRSKNKTIEKIENKMQGYGAGSRAIVLVVWKDGKSGHVFNVENDGGKIRYIDAQSGIERNISKTLSAAKPTKTLISRIDNLTPNPALLKKAIERK